jgi:regulator of protease activity HflC (stomatin/prohibitin superfamily)
MTAPPNFQEKAVTAFNGILILLMTLGVLAACLYGIFDTARGDGPKTLIIGYAIAIIVDVFLMAGLFTVQPNQGAVLTLFGKYAGTVKTQGLQWANPFYAKHHVSLRVRNFETNRLKVNDQDGNPIEIGAVVVWKVVDTAEASFNVDAYEQYVHVQSEAAIRNMATAYPYDSHEEHQISLRGHTAKVAEHLKTEIQDRLSVAGVEVVEARISHLAYAPEIAAAMLQRQQASAIIAARQKIVEGAVGMVEMALDMLARKKVVELDDERKASMVSNLLVVLCGDRSTQPVVNAGSIYH